MKPRLTREFYIPKDSVVVKDSNSEAIAYTNKEGEKPFAMLFAGKRSKPDKYYSFKTEERRDEYVKEYFEDIAASNERKKQYAETKKKMASANAEKYKVGDILYSSWGYDQTNIDFYQIVEKAKSMITIQKIGKDCKVTGNGYPDKVMPVKDCFISGEMKKRIGAYGISLTSYSSASPWDGKPKHETAWGFGH